MPFSNPKLYKKVQSQMLQRRSYHLWVSWSSYNGKGVRRVPGQHNGVTKEQDRSDHAAFSLAHDLWS